MLTPLDIHNKEFKRSFRGYNEDEIDDFLDQVVNDYEKLFRENGARRLLALLELLELLSRRMRVSRDIGQYKKEHNMPVLQAQRYGELLTRRADQAVRMGMDREFMRSVLQAIHEESIRQQMAVLGE